MSTRTIAPLLALLMAGCATVGQNSPEKARMAFDAAIAECRTQFPDRYAKPVTPRVSCLQDAVTAYNTKLASRDPAIPLEQQKIRAARIKELARQYDSGTITRPEYDAGAQQADAAYNRATGASG